MRARLLSLLAALAVACDAPTTNLPPGSGGPPAPPAPRLELDSDRLDLGRVPVGIRARARIGVRNAGDAPASLRVDAGGPVGPCGISDSGWCVVDGFGPWDLAPGARRELVVELVPSTAAPRLSARVELRPCDGCPGRSVDLVAESLAEALSCAPGRLDFEGVRIGGCRSAMTECRSPGTVPVRVIDLGRLPDQPEVPDFTVRAPPPPFVLDEGMALPIEVEFCPMSSGARTLELGIELDLARAERGVVRLPLRGVGLSPSFRIHAPLTALAEVAVYGEASTVVELESLTDRPLALALAGAPGRFLVPSETSVELPPGGRRRIELRARPEGPGPQTLVFTAQTTGTETLSESVSLSLVGIDPEPCTLEVRGPPEGLPIARGRLARIPVFLRSADAAACAVALERVELGEGAVEARLPEDLAPTGSGGPPTLRVEPGQGAVVVLTARADTLGDFQGALRLRAATATDVLVDLPLSVRVVEPQTEPAPVALDLGAAPAGCGPRTAVLDLVDSRFGPGSVREARVLPGAEGLETPVVGTDPTEPSASLPLEPPAAGVFGGWLQLGLAGITEVPRIVPIWGRVDPRPVRVRRRIPEGADVLFVLEGQRSGVEPQLAAGAADFFAQLGAAPEQVRLGVLRSYDGSSPRFAQLAINTLGERMIDASDPIAAAKLDTLFGLAERALRLPEPIRAVFRATDPDVLDAENLGLRRPGRPLVVVFAFDRLAGDRIPSRAWIPMLERAADGAPLAVVSIRSSPLCMGAGNGGLPELTERAGGVVVDTCDPGAADGWAAVLDAIRGGRRHRLGQAAVPESVELWVDGAAVPARGADGSPRWAYEPESSTVVFEPAWSPEPGAELEIAFRPACP